MLSCKNPLRPGCCDWINYFNLLSPGLGLLERKGDKCRKVGTGLGAKGKQGMSITLFTHLEHQIPPLETSFSLLNESRDKIKRIRFLNGPLTESMFLETTNGI